MQIFKFKYLISSSIFLGLIIFCLANNIFSIGFYIHKVLPYPEPKIPTSLPTFMFYDIYIMFALGIAIFLLVLILLIKSIIYFLQKEKSKEPNESLKLPSAPQLILKLETFPYKIHPNYIVALVTTIRDRRTKRIGLDSEANVRSLFFELNYPEYDLPWLWLSMVLNNPKNESDRIIERLSIEPWNSPDPEITAVWNYLSSKENLPNLLKRFESGELNVHAQKTLEKAISIARSRF